MRLAAGFLAGGLARRMGGGDKANLELGGKTLLNWQLEATAGIDIRFINANGEAGRFEAYGLPVIADRLDGFLGPLAGLHAMLCYLQDTHPEVSYLLSLATDAPFIPHNLDAQLASALAASEAEIAIASSGGRHHPVFALWPVSLLPELESRIRDDGIRKIDDFTSMYKSVLVPFDTAFDIPTETSSDGVAARPRPDPFMNINHPDDLKAAEAWLKRL